VDWKVLLSPPEMSNVEREMMLAAFDSGWVAPAGPDIEAFESELCTLSGAVAAVGLSSGTAALHLALEAVGVTAGSEVLMSDLTFAACAFAATYLHAVPAFVDSEPGTWQIDADLLAEELQQRARRGALPAAVVVVDLYGSVADGGRIADVCDTYAVPLVEDAAEAVGAVRDGIPAGRFGTVGIYSFNGNKIVTTGGGGALVTDRSGIADRVRFLATQARQPVAHYEHHHIGRNYRMGNINAAIGRGQLLTLSERIRQRQRVRHHYERRLGALDGVSFQCLPDGCRSNNWLTTVEVDPDAFGASSADVLAALRAAGVEARPGFMPMHLQPVFSGATVIGGEVAERHFRRSVSLPSSGRLSDEQLDWISDIVETVPC
jgi:dTDP-4-amino-4,6-dideoxygalactose transaminase